MHPSHGPCHPLSLLIVTLDKVEVRGHLGKTRLNALRACAITYLFSFTFSCVSYCSIFTGRVVGCWFSGCMYTVARVILPCAVFVQHWNPDGKPKLLCRF